MKAFLIDAAERQIREVEYVVSPMESPLSLQSHIGGFIETAYGWPDGDTLFVDEEGLLKPQLYFFRISTRPDQPFAGNGIVVGRERTNRQGDYLGTDDPKLTIEALRGMVTWMTRDQVDSWAKANASEPAAAIHYVENGQIVTEVTGRMGALYGSIPRPRPEPEPLGRLVEEDDFKGLKMIADRMGDGMILSPDQRRDLANAMHVILSRTTKVTETE